jgi:hypothetical protein
MKSPIAPGRITSLRIATILSKQKRGDPFYEQALHRGIPATL